MLLATPPGNPEATPIVVNGVMYLPSQGNAVLALDAETGKELWQSRAAEGDADDRARRRVLAGRSRTNPAAHPLHRRTEARRVECRDRRSV